MSPNEILGTLPHRFPMLLVDRIEDIVPGKSCRGIKNVTFNEPFFVGHYPGNPIMPGVLIVEAMAQAGAVILLTDPAYKEYIPVIGAIDEVRLRRPVVPGDTLETEAELLWFRQDVGRLKAVATVGGEVAAQMELTFKLVKSTERL